jgi:hypothetical protein
MDAGLLQGGMGILFFQSFFLKTNKSGILIAHNVLLMRRRAAFCAMWRSPNDRQEVKRISFVI